MELSVLIAGSGFPKLRSAVTLLREDGRATLVDTGLVEDRPRLLAALRAHGLGPKEIDCVVATHLHYDHCGNHLLFSRARFVVGATEFEDARGFMDAFHRDASPDKRDTADILRRRNQAVKDFYVRSIVREVTRNLDFYERVRTGDPRFALADGGCVLGRSIELLATPGHTAGHLSVVAHDVRVEGSASPQDVLIAGDALVTRRSLDDDGEGGPDLAANVESFRRTRRRLRDGYRYFVPGHDAFVDACEQVALEAGA